MSILPVELTMVTPPELDRISGRHMYRGWKDVRLLGQLVLLVNLNLGLTTMHLFLVLCLGSIGSLANNIVVL